ncbi:LOW QUALITY PROTEIN: hypothetical protein HID58_060492 [Brassica napus]|uniref:Uncharacterized protein n=1 Tax=Brassica napus TaxID=3708 RepID=A0ABQ7ZVV8_BRANA|nr:LOW QUALITY PROTEIN: hypothetical protein HID58_060492 [Brassica napus]
MYTKLIILNYSSSHEAVMNISKRPTRKCFEIIKNTQVSHCPQENILTHSFPSRFIDNNIDAKGQNFELLSFGSGRRICPGLNEDDFCGVLSGESVVSFSLGLSERMVVEDVAMEEAHGLTVSKKINHFDSLLLVVYSSRPRRIVPDHNIITMKVTTTPAAHLAFANLAYCSPSDLSQFAVPGSDLFLTNVADVHTENFVSHYWRPIERERVIRNVPEDAYINTGRHGETLGQIGVDKKPYWDFLRPMHHHILKIRGGYSSANKTGKPLLVKEASNLQIIPESCDNFVMITNGDGDGDEP